MQMDMQYEDMGMRQVMRHEHAARSAAWVCSIDMQREHEEWKMQHGKAAWRGGHETWTYSIDLQRGQEA